MEEIVASVSRSEGDLRPPKEFFDELVKECLDLNGWAASTAARVGMPHDQMELAKTIETHRQEGESGFREADQNRYSDALQGLESLKKHLIGVCQKIHQDSDTRTPAEKVQAAVRGAQENAKTVVGLAQAGSHGELEAEAKGIQIELRSLAQEAQTDPEGVREKVQRGIGRLEQLENLIKGTAEPPDRKPLVLDPGAPAAGSDDGELDPRKA